MDSSDEFSKKVFNDPIHGHIELHPLCIKIIDTPQFQRLRYIKHLGGCYLVFPGASHNRFEHSLGVCHLAGKLVRQLRSRQQPELKISDEDVLCVEIAGLCHDLGQGPFSHVFEKQFVPAVRGRGNKRWQHEDTSVAMFEHLIQENGLRKDFQEYHLNERDIQFIKEQIGGAKHRSSGSAELTIEDETTRGSARGTAGETAKVSAEGEEREATRVPYTSREKKKHFLYEIVANRRNGIDVDKWDYFARDCYGLDIKSVFDHDRFMHFARVLPDDDGEMQICSRDKEAGNLYDMFYIRNVLHRRAYQHKTTAIIEYMLMEALVIANDHFKLAGKNGAEVRISDAMDDMEAYTRLTDFIFHDILDTTEPELQKSRDILHRIETRKLYKFLGQTSPPDSMQSVDDVRRDLARISEDQSPTDPLKAEDFIAQIVTFDYGKGDQNPIDSVRFYRKNNVDGKLKAIFIDKRQVSQMLPEKFLENQLRVYCKRTDEGHIKLARKAFDIFKNRQTASSDVTLADNLTSLTIGRM